MTIKNIPEILSMPQAPVFSDNTEEYAADLQRYNSDLQIALEEYSRTLFGNVIEQPRWDDFRVPFTRDKQGQSSKPDFDFTNLGLLFPQNNTAEEVYLINQMPHEWRTGTPIRPHIHYIQDESTIPTFTMEYKLYDNGEAVPSSWTSIDTTGSGAFTYSSGSMLQILPFPEIDCSYITGVSAFLDVKFYRDDNDVTGDVLVKEWDFHYQRDSVGSREEYRK